MPIWPAPSKKYCDLMADLKLKDKPMATNDRERLRLAVEAFHIAEKNLKSVYDFLGQLALAAIGPLDISTCYDEPLISKPEGSPTREWWLSCDGFDKFLTAFDSEKEAKGNRVRDPIHVREITSTVAESQPMREKLGVSFSPFVPAHVRNARPPKPIPPPPKAESPKTVVPEFDVIAVQKAFIESPFVGVESANIFCDGARWGFNRGLEAAKGKVGK